MLIAAIMMCVLKSASAYSQCVGTLQIRSAARCASRAVPAQLAEFRDPLELDDPSMQSRPEELLGPWELKCTLSGFGDMWVELKEDGSCDCSSKCGKGVSWYAETVKGRWQITFKLLDKLKRPLVFEGKINDDDVRGRGISGMVRGPPKLGATPQLIKRGVDMGEFAGFHLNG